MRKIFSILVVLMMVAGTFVSCSMPTNDSTNAIVDAGAQQATSDFECTDGALKIVKNEYGELYLCTKDFSGDPTTSEKFAYCNGIKNKLGVCDNNLYLTSSEFAAGTSMRFNDAGDTLLITCPVLPASGNTTSTIKITSTNSTLKYKIN